MRIATESPGTSNGSQGIFNLMVFQPPIGVTSLNRHRELQVMTGRTRREDVVRRFEFLDSGPAAGGDPVVLHRWAHRSPGVRQWGRDYFEPMT